MLTVHSFCRLARCRETHDLLHTLFGFPPNLLPELGLKLFEATHYSLPMPVLSSISILSPFNTLSLAQRSLLLREYLPWAADAGRACRPLIGVYWERRWEQDIWDLREELGVSGLMPNREWEGMRFRGKTWREKEVIRERKERERVDMEAKLKEETEKMAAAQEVNSEGSPLL
jgi:ubiquinone biosynthesis protein COQ4